MTDHTHQPRGLFARFHALLRGLFGTWVRDRERSNPQAVYEQAISDRTRQYRELKQAVAGILYMRNKLEGEIDDRQREVALALDDIRRAVLDGDDDLGLALIHRKQTLEEELDRCEKELAQIRTQAEEAKRNLASFREEIRSLEREKVRTLATLANAHARRRIEEALEGLSVDADMRALEGVREYVARVSTEGRLDQELGDDGLRTRVREIRNQARDEASRHELEELKRRFAPREIAAPAGERTVGGAANGSAAAPGGARPHAATSVPVVVG